MIRSRDIAALCAALCFLVLPALAQYPPLSTEISPDHPLFLFAVAPAAGLDGAAYVPEVSEAWEILPPALKPYATLLVEAPPASALERKAFYDTLLPPLQEAGIPVVIGLDGAGTAQHLAPDVVEALFQAFTVIRGAQTRAPRFDIYPRPDAWPGPDPDVAVWVDLVERAARYGRFLHMPLADIHWPRMMANHNARPLYDKFTACKPYILPSVWTRGPHTQAQQSALMGLWLEGAVQQWGIAADARWHHDAHFLAPGSYGVSDPPAPAPPERYRAMILNGAMGGACVYAFPDPRDLWVQGEPVAWETVILPTLLELLQRGAIARPDFVLKNARVACQLATAGNPQEFHANLADIDPWLDKGLLVRGVYGGEKLGYVPELTLNRAARFWVPFLSPWASDAAKALFASVVPAGTLASPATWEGGVAPHALADGSGAAFVAKVGRGIFVFNTRENEHEKQPFTVHGAPAAVRTITAAREADAVVLSWPFREGDVSYTVYRRTVPGEVWEKLAEGLPDRTHRETPPDPQAAYAYTVTALTNEAEDFNGEVTLHQYLLFSAVESRIAEEVVLSAAVAQAQSVPREILGVPAAAPAPVVVVEPPAPEPMPAPAPASEAPAEPTPAPAPEAMAEPAAALTPSPAPEAAPPPAAEAPAPEPAPAPAPAPATAPEAAPAEATPAADQGTELTPPPAPAPDPAIAAREAAQAAITARLAQLETAVSVPDLTAVMELYAADYTDASGWGAQYVRKAFQWFFQRYRLPRLMQQVKAWNFDALPAEGKVTTRMYLRLSGHAVSDASGTIADVAAILPRTPNLEVDLTWVQRDGVWRIVSTNPAFPNLHDLLTYSAGPYDAIAPGPDVQ